MGDRLHTSEQNAKKLVKKNILTKEELAEAHELLNRIDELGSKLTQALYDASSKNLDIYKIIKDYEIYNPKSVEAQLAMAYVRNVIISDNAFGDIAEVIDDFRYRD